MITRLRPLVESDEHIGGAEWWVQLVNPNDPIGFHVVSCCAALSIPHAMHCCITQDKDESVASNKQYLKHPIWSSVFYLTDIGGGTLIPNQWSPWGNGYEPNKPEEGEWVFPKKNKYMLFDGTLLHGVVPGSRAAGKPAHSH